MPPPKVKVGADDYKEVKYSHFLRLCDHLPLSSRTVFWYTFTGSNCREMAHKSDLQDDAPREYDAIQVFFDLPTE